MSPKPRYGKRKHAQARSAARAMSGTTAVIQQTATAPSPALTPAKPAVKKAPPLTYPYIGTELKVIGILTAVVFIILVVLALILR